jgi:hypothetical protein
MVGLHDFCSFGLGVLFGGTVPFAAHTMGQPAENSIEVF